MIEFFGKRLQGLKAALHNHCTTSDGKFTPDEIIKLYAEEGFDVFAFTDHRKSNPVSTYDSHGMTLISGMELHPQGPRGILWHLVALDVPEDFQWIDQEAQACIDHAVNQGAVVFCAHPHWCGFTAEEVATLKNISGIEVYNSSCRHIGRAYNMQLWDELMDKIGPVNAIAVDDTHRPWELFHGWTVICARDNTVPAIMEALRSGSFYASQGPQFTKINFRNGLFEAEFTPCTEVIGVATPSGGYMVCEEDVQGPRTGVTPVTSCSLQLRQREIPTWFRLQIKDANGHYAWTNPVLVPPLQ